MFYESFTSYSYRFCALALVILLIIRNKKYETYFGDNLDNDYVNGKEESGNHHVEEVADSVH